MTLDVEQRTPSHCYRRSTAKAVITGSLNSTNEHCGQRGVYSDEILKKIAVEITDKLRKSTTVDWQVRDSVRAKLRILVRRTLPHYKYPPDKAAEAVDLDLNQDVTWPNSWTK